MSRLVGRGGRLVKPRPCSSGRSPGGLAGIGCLGIILLIALFAGVSFAVNKATEETVTFTVEDKERVTDCNTDGQCDSYYLIFTDKGTYKNSDSIMYGKFRSSDLYGKLKRGETFTCKTAGVRIGFTSSYKNIIECEGV